MSEEHLVEDWCFELDLENEGWINSGENGSAYALSEDKVIKITKDYNEFIQTFRILNSKSEFLPKIYDLRVFKDGELGILMEQLDTDNIEDLYCELNREAELQDVDIMEVDTEIGMLSEEAIKFANDISNSKYHMEIDGVAHFDIQPDNIGKNSFGNYVLFDQTKKATREYDLDIFEEIKEDLIASYSIDEPILKKDVPISRIIASRDAMLNTFNDVSNNRISRSEGSLECMINKNGDLQLIDGYHRLFEGLLEGKEEFDVEISLDERYGFLHPVYALVEKEDSLELDPDEPFCGLEDIACDETLGETLENYINYKEKLENKQKPKRLKM